MHRGDKKTVIYTFNGMLVGNRNVSLVEKRTVSQKEDILTSKIDRYEEHLVLSLCHRQIPCLAMLTTPSTKCLRYVGALFH